MGNNSLLLLLAPELVLTAGGLAILLAGLIWRRKESYRPLVYVAAAVGLVVLGVSLLSTVGAGLPQGMFVGDRLTSYIRVLAAGTTVLSLILALSRPQLGNEFPALLLFATLGITLAAGASNLVMIYVAIELLSITCYVLTGLFRDEARSNEAALKYFFYGAVASAVMVYGASFLYGLAGSPDLVVIAEVLSGTGAVGARWVAMPALILVMVGLGFKVAAVPFHQWSPDVYEGAPTPVTAYLSVGPKLAGFAVMMRVLAAMPAVRAETAVVVAVLAVLSMTVGNLVALSQSSLKRMLAYSSIAQAGYMLIGASVLAREGSRAPGGSAALLVYLLTYAVT
ncbi:MAG: NADH-quinone oxidoreductase subunit N, partial [Anaerolineae bacterium]